MTYVPREGDTEDQAAVREFSDFCRQRLQAMVSLDSLVMEAATAEQRAEIVEEVYEASQSMLIPYRSWRSVCSGKSDRCLDRCGHGISLLSRRVSDQHGSLGVV